MIRWRLSDLLGCLATGGLHLGSGGQPSFPCALPTVLGLLPKHHINTWPGGPTLELGLISVRVMAWGPSRLISLSHNPSITRSQLHPPHVSDSPNSQVSAEHPTPVSAGLWHSEEPVGMVCLASRSNLLEHVFFKNLCLLILGVHVAQFKRALSRSELQSV